VAFTGDRHYCSLAFVRTLIRLREVGVVTEVDISGKLIGMNCAPLLLVVVPLAHHFAHDFLWFSSTNATESHVSTDGCFVGTGPSMIQRFQLLLQPSIALAQQLLCVCVA